MWTRPGALEFEPHLPHHLNFMDRKTILVLVISFGLILVWQKLVVQKYYPQKPGTNLVSSATNQISTNTITGTNGVVSTNALQASTEVKKIDTIEKTLTITNQNAAYTFSSH